nr:hypothetical protein [Halegenticoccus soli]
MKNAEEATNPLEGISVVPEPSEAVLNQRQLIDYRSQREQCLEWLLTFGKEPERAEGYAYMTVKNRSHRMDAFYRWVWEEYGGYTANIARARGRLAATPRPPGEEQRA